MYWNLIARRLVPAGFSLATLFACTAAQAQEFYLSTGYGSTVLHYQNGTTTTFSTAGVDSLALDPFGTLYGAAFVAGNVYKYAPDGTRTLVASGFNGANQMAFDRSGNLFIGSYFANSIVRLGTNGTRTAFQNGVEAPQSMAFDSAGNLLVDSDDTIVKYSAADAESAGSSPTVIASGLGNPVGLSIGPSGDLFVSDSSSAQIYRVAPNGSASVFAPASGYPVSIGFELSGDLLVSDFSAGTVYEYAPNGDRTTVMSGLTYPETIAVVPEPSAWALTGTALTAMLIFRRRR